MIADSLGAASRIVISTGFVIALDPSLFPELSSRAERGICSWLEVPACRASNPLKRYNKTQPRLVAFMYEVTVEDTFAAGHYLRNYKGKCENPHGHNYKIRVTLAGAQLDK